MLYAVICTDRTDRSQLRPENRDAHLEFLKGLGDRLILAGPFASEDGSSMTGSLLIIEGPSLDAVRDIAAKDPYAKAGLFESVDIRPWKWTVNNPEG